MNNQLSIKQHDYSRCPFFCCKIKVKANPIIEEVFRNYIDNATKYAAQGKRIVIEAVENDGHVIVGVQDFGRAILEKDYPRIWNRSISLEICAKRGRGLGLAIVKHIADAHDAKVWVEPNEPKGNIFYLKIPRERIS